MCGFSQAYAQAEFSKLVVFGDSLSDTGNLAFIDLPEPYFDNRISDGPVLADFLAERIGSNARRSGHLLGQLDGYNYAVAGGNIVGQDPEDLAPQVSAYLQRAGNTADPDALYLVFMGGNDLRGLRSQTSTVLAEPQITEIITQLDTQIRRLVDAGARAFLVPDVANVGRIPETLTREAQDPQISLRATTYVRMYNQALSAMLANYQQDTRLSVVNFGLFSAFEAVLDNPSQFGFSTVEEGCFDPDTLNVELECLLFGFERRPFFDQLHPSSTANRIVSSALLANLPVLPKLPIRTGIFVPITTLLLEE